MTQNANNGLSDISIRSQAGAAVNTVSNSFRTGVDSNDSIRTCGTYVSQPITSEWIRQCVTLAARWVDDATQLDTIAPGLLWPSDAADHGSHAFTQPPDDTARDQDHGFAPHADGNRAIATLITGLGSTSDFVTRGESLAADADRQPSRHLMSCQDRDAASGWLSEAPKDRRSAILLVDDDDLIRETIADFLEVAGYSVVQAATGRSAYDIAQALPDIDIVVSDVVMPDVDGVKLAELLRSFRPNLPVVFITGYTHDFVLQGEMVLAKPFTFDALAGLVSKGLGRSTNQC